MKVKTKRIQKKKIHTDIKPQVSTETPKVSKEELHTFLDQCRSFEDRSPSSFRNFLAESYVKTFPTKPFPEGHSLYSIRLAVAYALQMKAYEAAGQLPPPEILRNYNAVTTFKVKDLSPKMRMLSELRSTTDNEIPKLQLAHVKKRPLERIREGKSADGKKITVTQFYIDLFEINFKSKCSDTILASKLREKFPNKKAYAVADVCAVRGLYNKGKLSGQNQPPKEKSVSYGK
jgi:hypothetical protein